MRNARLDKAQAGIKIPGRNINNLGYPDDSALKAESKEELKSLLMKVREESEKAGLKLNIQKMKIMASSPISSVQFSSVTQSCMTLYHLMNHGMLGLPVHHQLPEFTQIHMPSSHLILCRPLLLLPPISPSIKVFSNESTLPMRWPSTGASALASFLPKKSQG